MPHKRSSGWMYSTGFAILFFSMILSVSAFLVFSRHQQMTRFTYQSQLFSDKAGYYVYLPAVWYAGFDPDRFPAGMDHMTGDGFTLNHDQEKVFTKYPYGVALMISPFFLVTAWVHDLLGINPEGGFSSGFHLMVNVAALCYLLIGLLLLRRILLTWFPSGVTYLILILVYAGTNLLYYAVIDSLMSHLYSFVVIALFLYSLIRFLPGRRWGWWLMAAAAFSISVVIRPTNILLGVVLIGWNVSSKTELTDRIFLLIRPRQLVPFLAVAGIVLFPQLLYWKWAWGSWLFYSYHQEGFAHWMNPYLAEVWFAPKNGLFLYSPMALLMVIGIVLMIRKRMPNGWLLLVLFLSISYVAASWECWYFGCAFGHRFFVEYYVLFSIPLGFLLVRINSIRYLLIKRLLVWMIIVFTGYSVIMSLGSPRCFPYDPWDFTGFQVNLARANVLPLKVELDRQEQNPVRMTPQSEFNQSATRPLKDFPRAIPTWIEVTTRVDPDPGSPREAFLVCSVERNGAPVIYQAARMDSAGRENGEWLQVNAGFRIPGWSDPGCTLKIYWWNRKREAAVLDTMKIRYYFR